MSIKFNLRGRPGLNRGPLDLQSNALPLSYTPTLLDGWPGMISCSQNTKNVPPRHTVYGTCTPHLTTAITTRSISVKKYYILIFKLHNHFVFLSPSELVLVSDPPFGGRMELLAHNMKRIEQDWRTARHLDPQEQLPVLFIFPYFMEPQVLHNLSDFVMLDYQIDYDNHPLYSSGPKSMKNGSAVRVYVNQPASLFSFPESEGYHYCKPCNRWVFNNNKHCEKCKGCMSKDGRTYKHCDQCRKCVKPSWLHCTECSRCQPQDHKCKSHGVNGSSKITCHICGGSDHKRTDCPKKKKRGESFSNEHVGKKKKRRKQTLPSNLTEERERNLDILSQIISS
ncbi:rRNA N6-adenosine-methyltransferase ZCCHC4-like [Penaeus indicus]|uniref:rRNA N6-adenosine-methyltransferase ZCCHC4-like n=1 Tax=Penaeus indicus TaxID=29960 RepID=UPI00300CA0AD